ncbi:unnamed protein product [Rotaria sp. Silwood1]|nr:unnamed protein product [Rotaria sp. Silwood1]
MGFGTICALATATLVLVLLLIFKKPIEDSINTNGTQNSYLLWNSTKITVAGYDNGTNAATPIGLDHPRGIFIDGNDNLYIADNFNNRVQFWSSNATAGTTVAGDPNGVSGWTNGKMYYPTFVYVDSSMNMYIIDNGNSRVLKWSPGASVGITIAGTTGINTNSTSSFGQAWTMAVDTSNSRIYLADLWYNRILVWSFFANDSSYIIPLTDIVGVTIDIGGTVYATTHNLNTVTRFPAGSTNGTVIISSGLSLPWALRFDQYGNLYVANTGSGTIVMFCAGFTANSTGSIVASGLDQPVDIAFDSQMNMYVCEYGKHRVVKLAKLP